MERNLRKAMFAPNGYFPNGMSRPMRKVIIIRELEEDQVYIRYVDTGEKCYAYKRHLRESDR